MSFSVFLNFNGNCKEAVTFYADVFGLELPMMMTFDQAPPTPDYEVDPSDRGKIMYTLLNIHGIDVMFSDVPSTMPLNIGNNFSITIGSEDVEEIKALFNKMTEGGKIGMGLQETFWSECYGMVTDKFGVPWQFSLAGKECQ